MYMFLYIPPYIGLLHRAIASALGRNHASLRFDRRVGAGLVGGLPASAQDATAGDSFGLGQIIVNAARPEGIAIGGETIGQEAIEAFNRNSLDDAASLIPGVNASNTGGSRNERLIYVRGFDRFQVPLSIDGIRVYLPADNRLDYGRFLTPDIAEIQVAKGYASVLDGPGAMGGAINLVTRKPTQAIEAEARGVLSLDRDLDYAGYTVFALLGKRQDQWYAQASYARNFTDHWDLPGGFTPTATEDGGERDFSRTEDWRVNAKIGFTPNATDEYSLSYTRQEGSKNAPLHVTDPLSTQRFWSWPYWNLDSVYFLSTTALGDQATLKTRIYRNTFDNLLRSFNDRNPEHADARPRLNSYYEDEAWGGSADLGVDLTPADTLHIAAHYRRDRHVEYQQSFPAGTTEPRQTNLEETWSIAAENKLALSPTVDLTFAPATIGATSKRPRNSARRRAAARRGCSAIRSATAMRSTARRGSNGARTATCGSTPAFVARPLPDHLRTVQLALRRGHLRSRSQVGTGDQLRDRRREEVGRAAGRGQPLLFAPDRRDRRLPRPVLYLHQFVHAAAGPGAGLHAAIGDAEPQPRQRQLLWRRTVAERRRRQHAQPRRQLHLCAPRSRRSDHAAFQPTGVPSSKGFAYAEWTPLGGLHVLPSVEASSNRWTVNTAGTRYFRTAATCRPICGLITTWCPTSPSAPGPQPVRRQLPARRRLPRARPQLLPQRAGAVLTPHPRAGPFLRNARAGRTGSCAQAGSW